MAYLSIIIPANRDTASLEDARVSGLTHRPEGCEILVPHAGTYDDPYGMAGEIALLDCDPRGTSSELVAQAIAAAQGELVHLLSPGCEVTSDWLESAIEQFDDPQVAAVSPLLEEESTGRIVMGVANGFAGGRREVTCQAKHVSSRRVQRGVIGPTSSAAFYRRSALDAIGGWPAEICLSLADLDVALSLREAGFERAIDTNCVIRVGEKRVYRTGAFGRAASQERLFWRHRRSGMGRMLRPLVALAQCLGAGLPWSMAAAAMGKVASRGAKESGAAHRQRIADLAVELNAAPAGDDVELEQPVRRAAA